MKIKKSKFVVLLAVVAVVSLGLGTALGYFISAATGKKTGTLVGASAEGPTAESAEAHVVTEEDFAAEGYADNELKWTLYTWKENDGVNAKLVFTGSGNITSDSISEDWRDFSECSEYVTLIDMSGADITMITEEAAFYGMEALQKVILPDGLEVIGNLAFPECPKLKTIVFPESLIVIGDSAFYKDASLQTVTFPASLRWIGNSAFEDALDPVNGTLVFECARLLNEGYVCTNSGVDYNQMIYFSIDETVELSGDEKYSDPMSGTCFYIGNGAFRCVYVKRIEFAKGVEVIPDDLFEETSGALTEAEYEKYGRGAGNDLTYVFPNTVTYIGYNNTPVTKIIYRVYSDCSNTVDDIKAGSRCSTNYWVYQDSGYEVENVDE